MEKLIQKISKIPKKYFTFADIRKISNLEDKSLKVALNRLVKSKQLKRIAKGIYSLEPSAIDWEELAVELYYPSYLSFEWALAHYGILSQKPNNITLATLKQSKNISLEEKVLVYHHLQKKMFWGYVKENDYLIAAPEKVFLDLAYLSLNGYAKFDIEEMNLKLLNKKVLKKYLKKINNQRLSNLLARKMKF